MSQKIDLHTFRGNDRTFAFELTEGDGPLDVTGLTLTFYLKASALADDATATTIAPTVTNAAQGQVSVAVPHTATATTGTRWWRLDAVDPAHGDDRLALLYGTFTVIPV